MQKGKTAEALEEYLLVLRDDPENDVVRQLSADLCLSLSRNADAVRLLGELFERQVAAGDATRASLTYKKLARHGSPTWQQKFRFGQLAGGVEQEAGGGHLRSGACGSGEARQEEGGGRDVGSHRRAGADAGEPVASGGNRVGTGKSQSGGGGVSASGAAGGEPKAARPRSGTSAPIRRMLPIRASRWPMGRACWRRARWARPFLFLNRKLNVGRGDRRRCARLMPMR